MYDRQKYLEAIKTQLEPNIFNHSLAVEAAMSGMYDYLQSKGLLASNEPARQDWELAGLIHDIDYSAEFKQFHPNKTREALAKYDLEISDTIDNIIKAHSPQGTGVKPTSKAQWTLFCADSLTGLIVAVALIYPSKKLADVKVSSVLKRFLKEPKFAAGTRRDEVAMCEKTEGLNISIEQFIEIVLKSMQKISNNLGL